MTKVVKKIILDNSETKFDEGSFSFEINTTKTIQRLANVGQGVTEITRVGDKITPIGLNIKFCISNANAGINGPSCSRLMIVRSRIPDRVLAVTDMPGLLNKSDYNKIFVLYDKYFTVTGPDGSGPQSITRKIFIKKKRFLRLEYVAGSSDTALNMPYVYVVGDFAAANGNAPDIKLMYNLSYKDI